jgi:NADH-quinone oxidoreductase subunit L
MWLPLAALGVLSLAGGLLFNIPEFLKGIFPAIVEPENPMLMYISVASGLAGILLAALMYLWKPGMADSVASVLGGIPYRAVYNKYGVDEAYGAMVVKPVVAGSRWVLWKVLDAGLIDGLVNGIGARARDAGSLLRLLQSGNLRSYATWVLFGAVAVIVAMGLVGGVR